MSLTDNLIAHYTFGNLSNVTGNADYDLVAYEGAAASGGVLLLPNGSSGAYPTNEILIDQNGNDKFTVSMWFKDLVDRSTRDNGFLQFLADHPVSPAGSLSHQGVANYLVAIYENDELGVFDDGQPHSFESTGFQMLPANYTGWHHLVLVHNNGITTFYVDGVQAGVPVSFTPTDVIQVFGSFSTIDLGNGNTFNPQNSPAAAFDNIRVYNDLLSASDISELYTLEQNLPTAQYSLGGNVLDTQGSYDGTAPTLQFIADGDLSGRDAASFDGTQSFTVPHDVLGNMDSSYTISMWLKPSAFPPGTGNYYDIMHNDQGNDSRSFNLRISSDGEVYISHLSSAGAIDTHSGFLDPDSLTEGQWSHITITYDSTVYRDVNNPEWSFLAGSVYENGYGALRIYKDGVFISKKPMSQIPWATPNDLIIGKSSGNTTGGYQGLMANLNFWDDQVLTDAEVQQVYNYESLVSSSSNSNENTNNTGENNMSFSTANKVQFLFEGDLNATADSGGTGPLTATGSPVYVDSGVTAIGQAIQLGDGKFLNLPSDMSHLNSSDGYTISFWMKGMVPISSQAGGQILGTTTSGHPDYEICAHHGAGMFMDWGDGGGHNETRFNIAQNWSNDVVNDTEWRQYVFVVRKTDASTHATSYGNQGLDSYAYYINGALKKSEPYYAENASGFSSGGPSGYGFDPASKTFDSSWEVGAGSQIEIAEFTIYDAPAAPADVAALYGTYFPARTDVQIINVQEETWSSAGSRAIKFTVDSSQPAVDTLQFFIVAAKDDGTLLYNGMQPWVWFSHSNGSPVTLPYDQMTTISDSNSWGGMNGDNLDLEAENVNLYWSEDQSFIVSGMSMDSLDPSFTPADGTHLGVISYDGSGWALGAGGYDLGGDDYPLQEMLDSLHFEPVVGGQKTLQKLSTTQMKHRLHSEGTGGYYPRTIANGLLPDEFIKNTKATTIQEAFDGTGPTGMQLISLAEKDLLVLPSAQGGFGYQLSDLLPEIALPIMHDMYAARLARLGDVDETMYFDASSLSDPNSAMCAKSSAQSGGQYVGTLYAKNDLDVAEDLTVGQDIQIGSGGLDVSGAGSDLAIGGDTYIGFPGQASNLSVQDTDGDGSQIGTTPLLAPAVVIFSMYGWDRAGNQAEAGAWFIEIAHMKRMTDEQVANGVDVDVLVNGSGIGGETIMPGALTAHPQLGLMYRPIDLVSTSAAPLSIDLSSLADSDVLTFEIDGVSVDGALVWDSSVPEPTANPPAGPGQFPGKLLTSYAAFSDSIDVMGNLSQGSGEGTIASFASYVQFQSDLILNKQLGAHVFNSDATTPTPDGSLVTAIGTNLAQENDLSAVTLKGDVEAKGSKVQVIGQIHTEGNASAEFGSQSTPMPGSFTVDSSHSGDPTVDGKISVVSDEPNTTAPDIDVEIHATAGSVKLEGQQVIFDSADGNAPDSEVILDNKVEVKGKIEIEVAAGTPGHEAFIMRAGSPATKKVTATTAANNTADVVINNVQGANPPSGGSLSVDGTLTVALNTYVRTSPDQFDTNTQVENTLKDNVIELSYEAEFLSFYEVLIYKGPAPGDATYTETEVFDAAKLESRRLNYREALDAGRITQAQFDTYVAVSGQSEDDDSDHFEATQWSELDAHTTSKSSEGSAVETSRSPAHEIPRTGLRHDGADGVQMWMPSSGETYADIASEYLVKEINAGPAAVIVRPAHGDAEGSDQTLFSFVRGHHHERLSYDDALAAGVITQGDYNAYVGVAGQEGSDPSPHLDPSATALEASYAPIHFGDLTLEDDLRLVGPDLFDDGSTTVEWKDVLLAQSRMQGTEIDKSTYEVLLEWLDEQPAGHQAPLTKASLDRVLLDLHSVPVGQALSADEVSLKAYLLNRAYDGPDLIAGLGDGSVENRFFTIDSSTRKLVRSQREMIIESGAGIHVKDLNPGADHSDGYTDVNLALEVDNPDGNIAGALESAMSSVSGELLMGSATSVPDTLQIMNVGRTRELLLKSTDSLTTGPGINQRRVVQSGLATLRSAQGLHALSVEGQLKAANMIATADGELQAYGEVGLGHGLIDDQGVSDILNVRTVRSWGEFKAEKKVELKEEMQILSNKAYLGQSPVEFEHNPNPFTSIDSSLNSGRVLYNGDAHFQVRKTFDGSATEDADVLLGSKLSATSLLAGSDIWFGKELHKDMIKAKSELRFEDKHTDGDAYLTNGSGAATTQVHGYVMAPDAATLESLIRNGVDVLHHLTWQEAYDAGYKTQAELDTHTDPQGNNGSAADLTEITFVNVCATLQAAMEATGGATVRERLSAAYGADDSITLANAFFAQPSQDSSGNAYAVDDVIDSQQAAAIKKKLELYHNGLRVLDSEYELVFKTGSSAGATLKLLRPAERRDTLIVDTKVPNPG